VKTATVPRITLSNNTKNSCRKGHTSHAYSNQTEHAK